MAPGSTPWGEPDHGPCDKCHGTGKTTYSCRSCLERQATPECPACHGRIEFTDVCPACEGDGEITRTRRDGVSVFPSEEGLRRYIEEREADAEGCVMLELEGELTGDRDLDADAGALLVRPTRVVAKRPFGDIRVSR
jgi:RecJ-like exonuclease